MPPHKTNANRGPAGRQRAPKPGTPKAGGPANPRAKAAGKAVRKARRTGMGANVKVTLGLVAAALAVLVVAVVANRAGGEEVPASEVAQTVVRADSHRLSTAPDGKVTVVEFLDFECEACGAAYPGVERLRAEYGDRITYVVRYFPIASHPNAFNAAHAAEAAARQGKFEQMYIKLFDNQTTWGRSQQSQAETFEKYAGELGLDVEKFRADVASPEVDARVRADAEDGERLGVRGTPTFFVNGARYEQEPTYEALKKTIDDALAR